MSNFDFEHYTPDYISGIMSLRKPQEDSLNALDEIIKAVKPTKGMDLEKALSVVNSHFPTCTDFERDFMSLTFALATGVGKTRLMGAFIAYLYTQHDIKNFFVVAPGTTVYEKLKDDMKNINSPKYIFKGLGCFSKPPKVITDDAYSSAQATLFDGTINIYIFNIDKFNKENANMKKINEYLGQSFYDKLASLKDLVLIMDESHHYRADSGAAALNELKPLLGLELTATPLYNDGGQQKTFKNVVIEYPLSKAIADGYTRTPYAVARSNVKYFNFGEEQLDKLMINDGIFCHERLKTLLKVYAEANKKEIVKPFMMIVCKDTDHANWVKEYVTSDEFRNGAYKYKTIIVHSKQKGSESQANTEMLLSVEKNTNPIEVVIHVNKLKEGWDVNNLYTIVPLRQAASKILREQMVGRGLRLPYGKRTNDDEIDGVYLTAHDKFEDILKEAQKGDSIFKAGNIINVEDLEPEEEQSTQLTFDLDEDNVVEEALTDIGLADTQENKEFIKETAKIIEQEVTKSICKAKKRKPIDKEKVVSAVKKEINENKDLADVFKQNENPIMYWLEKHAEKLHIEAQEKFIPIPHIKVTDAGVEEFHFTDFEIDLSDFTHVPIEDELFLQSLKELDDRRVISGAHIDFDSIEPPKEILSEIVKKPEIDYEECSELLFKLITAVCEHFKNQFDENGLKNIVMMNKKDISNKIYQQMMKHFYVTNGFIQEEVTSVSDTNEQSYYNYERRMNLFEEYGHGIKSVLFDGIKYGVFKEAKFDSRPELVLARVLERDAHNGKVKNWLRPAKTEFNITYNRGHQYEPDFVVECEDMIYLVEVKGEDKIDEADVISKKHRAIQYCIVASNWAKANNKKEWKHVFIPSQQVLESSTFEHLSKQFIVTDDNVEELF